MLPVRPMPFKPKASVSLLGLAVTQRRTVWGGGAAWICPGHLRAGGLGNLLPAARQGSEGASSEVEAGGPDTSWPRRRSFLGWRVTSLRPRVGSAAGATASPVGGPGF